MTGSETQPELPGLDALLREPSSFEFVRAVMLLCYSLPEATPDDLWPGRASSVADEWIRFVHDPSFSFQAGDIRRLEVASREREETRYDHVAGQGVVYELCARMLGLTGAGTPLPASMVEHIGKVDEYTGQKLLDVIHHRIYGLLFRMHYEMGRLWSMERDSYYDEPHPLSVLWSIGGASCASSIRDRVDSVVQLHQSAASIETLEDALSRELRAELQDLDSESDSDILEHEHEAPTLRVEGLTGAWVEIAQSGRWNLGNPQATLEGNTLLGTKAWIPSMGATIRVDGLQWGTYLRNWTTESDLDVKINRICDRLLNEPLEWTLELSIVDIPKLETPQPRMAWSLGSPRKLGDTARLLSNDADSLTVRRVLERKVPPSAA